MTCAKTRTKYCLYRKSRNIFHMHVLPEGQVTGEGDFRQILLGDKSTTTVYIIDCAILLSIGIDGFRLSGVRICPFA